MLLVETAIFYLLLGVAVAVAVYIRGRTADDSAILLQTAAACMFWPLFVPMLLRADNRHFGHTSAIGQVRSRTTRLARRRDFAG